ncbi:MAG: DNA-3-methyladenine glycosylase [Acidobacteria bacterium]|nr:DNA-3-methyladenine glycosylase [Acidobacteriota bacterium]
MRSNALPRSFYERPTLQVAQDLLGKLLVRVLESGQALVGRIVETEGYVGEDDPACHAHRGLTVRNVVMYGEPGHAYVYFTYGMHHMLNAVTERPGFPAAVLIRALEPMEGTDEMFRLRPKACVREDLMNGPGKICQAMAINRDLNGSDLCGHLLFIRRTRQERIRVVRTHRIGIREGREKLWRFYIAGHPCVSQK